MFVRARWFVLGATAGTALSLKAMRRAKEILPGHLRPIDLAEAWQEGRAAMGAKERELRKAIDASSIAWPVDLGHRTTVRKIDQRGRRGARSDP